MNVMRVVLPGAMAALLSSAALADVIPISAVNEDDENGDPVLWTETVTVRGVVTVGTGMFADNNEIYVQDDSGGVCVIQEVTASPWVAPGDSVQVTGKVDVVYYKRTYIKVHPGSVPGSRITLLSSGNPVPDPLPLTPAQLMVDGEEYEGRYAVVRDVYLPYEDTWPSGGCVSDTVRIADGDTASWLWLDPDTDLCGSAPPLDRFDLYGVVVPDPQSPRVVGHGIMPPQRSSVRSRGSGAGTAEVDPDWVYEEKEVDLEFEFTGEADTLTSVSVEIPLSWSGFSGDPECIVLEGEAFESAIVDSASSTRVIVSHACLVYGTPGALTITGLVPPGAIGDCTFTISTAVFAGELVEIMDSPTVHTAASTEPGSVVINEVYAYSVRNYDSAEFIELYNPGRHAVPLAGWVLTDIDDTGECGGSNLWEFPSDAEIESHGYLAVARDAKWSGSIGFAAEFGEYPDYELFDDDYHYDIDNGSTANLTRVSPSDGDGQTSQEIRLLGGCDGTGAMVSGVPAYEAVYLYSDRLRTTLVDAMEYRDSVFFSEDHCCDEPALGGADDAYVPGPPPRGYSLGRDEESADTDATRADFTASSTPTPGEVNSPLDDEPPELVEVAAAGDRFITVQFSEPLDPVGAVDETKYEVTGGLEILGAWLSRDRRTVLLASGVQDLGQEYELAVSGILDAAGKVLESAAKSFSGYHEASTPISEIQAYDENGYSPLEGAEVGALGFATVPPGVFQPGNTSMYIEDLDGWGVNVFTTALLAEPPLAGDLVGVRGVVEEYGGGGDPGLTTEITKGATVPLIVTVLARGFDCVQPVDLSTGDVNDEDREGSLVTTSGVVTRHGGFSFYIDDGSGATQIYQSFTDLDFSEFAVGDSVEITGVVMQYDYTEPFLGGYELAPRYSSDLVKRTAHHAAQATVSATAGVLNADKGEEVAISYSAPMGSQVTVRVFDLQGRSVATIYDGLSLGSSRGTWDGRDDRGRTVPPGVYILNVQAKGRGGGDVSDASVPVVVGTKLR